MPGPVGASSVDARFRAIDQDADQRSGVFRANRWRCTERRKEVRNAASVQFMARGALIPVDGLTGFHRRIRRIDVCGAVTSGAL